MMRKTGEGTAPSNPSRTIRVRRGRRAIERREEGQLLVARRDVKADDAPVAAGAPHPPTPVPNPDDFARRGKKRMHFLQSLHAPWIAENSRIASIWSDSVAREGGRGKGNAKRLVRRADL